MAQTSTTSNTNSPNVASVVLYSATVPAVGPLAPFLGDLFTERETVNLPNGPNADLIFNPGTYEQGSGIREAATVLNANIGTALSILPLPSPASGVIFRTDPVTGAPLPVSSTLGPIFTERAETIGKNKYYIAITHQDFHFTSFNGQSLNGLTLLSPGGQVSAVSVNNQVQSTVPSTLTWGADIRLSQNVAFLTYGVTNRIDVSLALPLVHAAVASKIYNATVYAGSGMGNPVCWCVDTASPGTPPTAQSPTGLYQPFIAQSSLGKTGIGDVLFRVKGTVLERPHLAIAVGSDVRLPTGDALNLLGTGTTSVRPFTAISLYTKRARGLVFAPHLNVGWQFSGKSVLAGEVAPTPQTLSVQGQTLTYYGPPYTFSKAFLPDVFSWAVGSEVGLGTRNTIVVDVLGNRIGLINGIPTAVDRSVGMQASPIPPTYAQVSVRGITATGRTSFGEYTAAFGYKAKVVGNLIATFNMLVRIDNNGFIARAVPLYGLGYEF